jgi:membrane protein
MSESTTPEPKQRPSHALSLWQLVKDSATAWSNDYASSMGAALAYYTLFSLAPLLLLVISVAGLAFGDEAARGQIVGQLDGLIGKEGATAVEGLLKSGSEPAKSAIASIISFVTLIVGATSIFAELQSDLDRIWRAPDVAKPSGIWGMLRTRLLSFGLIVSIGFLLLVSLVVSAGLAAMGTWWGAWFGGWVTALQIFNQIVSLFFVTALFALMYRILPSVRVAWDDVWHGALATGVLFTVGKYAIGMYLGKAGVQSGFGAAGSIVVLLVWVFYSSQIFLLGAEFTWLYAHNYGSRAGEALPEGAAPTSERRAASERHAPLALPAIGQTTIGQAAAMAQPKTGAARDFATAGLVWVGIGIVRSLFGRRTPVR